MKSLFCRFNCGGYSYSNTRFGHAVHVQENLTCTSDSGSLNISSVVINQARAQYYSMGGIVNSLASFVGICLCH